MTTQSGADPARRGGPGTRMECKVCWYVYEPAAGDAIWQIPPDTPWGELPAHWSCPTCAATRDDFLALPDE